jgi:hypothetical protein
MHDEAGASLILAIVFLVVVGALATSTLARITSAFNDRTSLDATRNREYAADAAIEYAIAAVRSTADGTQAGPGLSSCPPTGQPSPHKNFSYSYQIPQPSGASFSIRVDCVNDPISSFNGGFLQRDVLFTACADQGSDCDSANNNRAIIRAQINYQASGALDAPVVTGTIVQSWSVNG